MQGKYPRGGCSGSRRGEEVRSQKRLNAGSRLSQRRIHESRPQAPTAYSSKALAYLTKGRISYAMQTIFNALIRTHHITSRRKVAKLKQAASAHDVFVLLRSGGPPGVMYAEGQESGVTEWVNVVQVCGSSGSIRSWSLLLTGTSRT